MMTLSPGRHRPEYLAGFDRAGTVMDLVVAALVDLETPVTSDQVGTRGTELPKTVRVDPPPGGCRIHGLL